MKRYVMIGLLFGLVFLASATAFAAQASLLERAYLSGNGNDNAPCTLQRPCRLLPAALSSVQTGGEVWMLDSATYNNGRVTITRSVSILAVPGALGSVVSTGTSDSAIAITGSAVKVSLRNLIFRKDSGVLDLGARGVQLTADGSQLIVDGSEFGNGLGMSVDVETTNAQVAIYRSAFRGSMINLATVGGGAASVNAVVDHCNIIGLRGPDANGSAIVAVDANVTVSHSNISHADTGIQAIMNATVVLEDDVIAANGYGVDLSAGDSTVRSTGNNTFQFNSTDVFGGALTTVTRM